MNKIYFPIFRIVRLREMALIEKWIHNTFDKLPRRNNDPSQAEKAANESISLSLKNILSIFIIWFIGILSSVVGIALEYAMYLWKKTIF